MTTLGGPYDTVEFCTRGRPRFARGGLVEPGSLRRGRGGRRWYGLLERPDAGVGE